MISIPLEAFAVSYIIRHEYAVRNGECGYAIVAPSPKDALDALKDQEGIWFDFPDGIDWKTFGGRNLNVVQVEFDEELVKINCVATSFFELCEIHMRAIFGVGCKVHPDDNWPADMLKSLASFDGFQETGEALMSEIRQ